MTLAFMVNGSPVSVDAPPAGRLSDVLRGALGLTGTKVGCDAGDCGACTVLIDGAPSCACLTAAAQVAGCDVVTVEGLGDDGVLSDLQQSFLQHGAAQCGICTPGMLIAAAALLRRVPHPTRGQVEDALGGVLCRCTGYRKIVDAVLHATDLQANGADAPTGASVGASVLRLDGAPKVLGRDRFGADDRPDDAVLVRIIRSPHHHARFTIGDVDAFITGHPDVLAVFTAENVLSSAPYGVIPAHADQPVFAVDTVRFRGEAIAAVAGEPAAITALDPATFPVQWEPLPAMLTPADARADQAAQLHDHRTGNVLVRGYVERGDIDAAFAAAEHQAEARFSTPFIEHAYIEPEAGVAVRVDDRIEIFGCTQAPHMDRTAIAAIMDVEEEAVRIRPSACGGGFGSKLDLSVQPYIALAAWQLKRPAAIAYTRTESMQSTTKRHPSEISLRIGCDADGRITAFDFDGIFNTGAYASWGPTVADRVPIHASGPYYTPNYRARSTAVLTNCPPSGAFRGFGVPQSAVAQESVYDMLADQVGLDRLDFRLLNALDNGKPTVTGQIFETGVGIRECLEALKPAWRRAISAAEDHNAQGNGAATRRGVGIASCWYGCGNTSMPNPSTIRMGITGDGRIVLHQGATDIGQGSNTVIAQIAADALGVGVRELSLVDSDTDRTPDAGKTSASRQTFVTGSAAKRAGEALRAAILRHANVSATARIEVARPAIILTDEATRATIDLSELSENRFGYVFMVEEVYDPSTKPLDDRGQGAPYAVYGYGAQIVELTVDTALGTVKLDRITAAHDVGRAINPLLVEGQIEGGIAQGIGMALMETYIPGRTENLHDYLIPTMGDVPEIESIIVEVADPVGPYGAKGLGEHVLIPTAPAILNAIRHATGAAVRHLPATPDTVYAAICEGEAND